MKLVTQERRVRALFAAFPSLPSILPSIIPVWFRELPSPCRRGNLRAKHGGGGVEVNGNLYLVYAPVSLPLITSVNAGAAFASPQAAAARCFSLAASARLQPRASYGSSSAILRGNRRGSVSGSRTAAVIISGGAISNVTVIARLPLRYAGNEPNFPRPIITRGMDELKVRSVNTTIVTRVIVHAHACTCASCLYSFASHQSTTMTVVLWILHLLRAVRERS